MKLLIADHDDPLAGLPAERRSPARRASTRGRAPRSRPALLWAAGLLLAAAAAPAPTNWADRLGYGAGNKILILHADDAGMFPGTNSGIGDLLASGEIQSASAMPPVPFFGDLVAWYNAQPAAPDVGLHLTLNAEWDTYRWGPSFDPPPGVKRILKHKFLFWGWRPVFPGSSFYTFLYRGPLTMQRELRAQLEAAVSGLPARGGRPAVPPMSPPPSHLDSHVGSVFIRRSHFKKYLELAREYHDDPAKPSIPALTFENFEVTKRCFLEAPGDEVTRRLANWLTGRLERAQRAVQPWPFPRLDQYCPVPYGDDLARTRLRLRDLIRDELPPGITQILFHPSDEDPLLRSSMSPARADRRVLIDRRLFDPTDPANVLLPVLSAPDVHFTTWRNMAARFATPDLCVDPADGYPWERPSTCP